MTQWLVTYSVQLDDNSKQIYTTVTTNPDPKLEELLELVQLPLVNKPKVLIDIWGAQPLEPIPTTAEKILA